MSTALREQLTDSLAQVRVEQAVEALHSAISDIHSLQGDHSNDRFFRDELDNLGDAYRQLGFAVLNATRRAAA